MEKILEKRILKILKKLQNEKIEFYIVGGMALVLYGIPRTTLDIDIIIPADREIIQKLFKILKEENFKSEQEDILKIENPEYIVGQWITFSDEKGRELFDFFIEKKETFNLNFQKNINYIEFGDFKLPVASLDLIKKMKIETKREIDIYDLKLIEDFEKNK
jgi:hypothetical protein